MIYKGKNFRLMSNDELLQAHGEIHNRLNEVNAKRATEKFQNKFRNQQLPPLNPLFMDLVIEIDAEIAKRGLV